MDKDYYEVPDLSNLTITCLDSLTIDLFGTVIQHYDALAMIKPKPGMYYLDVDTMLFDENRKPVGRIYELMGLIESPIYNILFPSEDDAKKVLPVGKQVYFAPEAPEEFTKILVISQLEAKALVLDRLEFVKNGQFSGDDTKAVKIIRDLIQKRKKTILKKRRITKS